jgi:uncharacterized membrane protein YbhN (UPF0104 family)
MTRKSWWRLAQAVILVVVLWFAGQRLWQQWANTNRADLRVTLDLPRLIVASVIVLATYLLLIETWRVVLARYGSTLPFGAATRIWFVSNLGKYIPGKVWQIGAMTMFVGRYGIGPATAGAAAIVITVANVAAGFAFVLAAAAPSLSAWGGPRATLLATGILLLILACAPVMARAWTDIAHRFGRPTLAVRVPPTASLLALVGTAIAWALYGVAFRIFAQAVLGAAEGGWLAWGAAYTLSYLVGYLTLIVPGGFGVREVTLTQILTTLGLTTPAQAVIVALTSRLWITVLEIAPGVVALIANPDLRVTRASTVS